MDKYEFIGGVLKIVDTLKVPKIFLSFWLKLDILTIHKLKRKIFEILLCNTCWVNSDF